MLVNLTYSLEVTTKVVIAPTFGVLSTIITVIGVVIGYMALRNMSPKGICEHPRF